MQWTWCVWKINSICTYWIAPSVVIVTNFIGFGTSITLVWQIASNDAIVFNVTMLACFQVTSIWSCLGCNRFLSWLLGGCHGEEGPKLCGLFTVNVLSMSRGFHYCQTSLTHLPHKTSSLASFSHFSCATSRFLRTEKPLYLRAHLNSALL